MLRMMRFDLLGTVKYKKIKISSSIKSSRTIRDNIDMSNGSSDTTCNSNG